jgi:hypothetical protein
MARPVATIQQEIRELSDAQKEEILTMLIAELDGPADAGVEAAAENALALEEGLSAIAEWEAEHGALMAHELAATDAALNSARGRR